MTKVSLLRKEAREVCPTCGAIKNVPEELVYPGPPEVLNQGFVDLCAYHPERLSSIILQAFLMDDSFDKTRSYGEMLTHSVTVCPQHFKLRAQKDKCQITLLAPNIWLADPQRSYRYLAIFYAETLTFLLDLGETIFYPGHTSFQFKDDVICAITIPCRLEEK